jgi:hypothetical protein
MTRLRKRVRLKRIANLINFFGYADYILNTNIILKDIYNLKFHLFTALTVIKISNNNFSKINSSCGD